VELTPLTAALSLFAITFVGALPPMHRGWSPRGLHQLVSVAAGIFLGSVFLHLLPEIAGVGHAHQAPGAEALEASRLPWFSLLAGFLLLFVVERVWLHGRQERRAKVDAHAVLLSATFVGLALHSAAMGLGLGAFFAEGGWRWPLFLSLLTHKAAEAFSLAAVMSLAGLGRRRTGAFLAIFATITPLGLVFADAFPFARGSFGMLVSGFAAGTFLYVAVCDLLPEVFHDTDRSWTKLGWVLLGIGITAVSLPGAEGAPAFVRDVLAGSVATFRDMAFYLIMGFAIAGVLSLVLRPETLTRHLAGDDARSVAKASVIGAPLPLCSCSVVPVALSLRRAGASKGATSAFLISTPETGVDSVSVTWALLDPLMTIVRPIAAILSGIATGLSVNFFVRRSGERDGPAPEPVGPDAPGAAEPAAAGACCAAEAPRPPARVPERGVRRALRFAFVDMLDDLTGALLAGVLLSGVLAAAVPESFFEQPVMQGFGGMLLMLLLGIPIYVCAAASTPIAATLILKGLSPGAGLVFLLAGPATNLASLFALSKILGRRALAVHLVALALVTLALGFAVDALYPWLGIVPSAASGHEHGLVPGWLSRAAAIVLAVLMVVSLLRTRLGVQWGRRTAAAPPAFER